MQLKPISDLIDSNTRIARILANVSPLRTTFTGYLAFVVKGKLIERRIKDMAYNTQFDSCFYVVFDKVNYAVNLPCKPVSGDYDAKSLKA